MFYITRAAAAAAIAPPATNIEGACHLRAGATFAAAFDDDVELAVELAVAVFEAVATAFCDEIWAAVLSVTPEHLSTHALMVL